MLKCMYVYMHVKLLSFFLLISHLKRCIYMDNLAYTIQRKVFTIHELSTVSCHTSHIVSVQNFNEALFPELQRSVLA